MPAATTPLIEYRKVVPYLRPYSRSLALVIAIGLLATLSVLAQPWLTRDLIDQALLRGTSMHCWYRRSLQKHERARLFCA